MLEIRTPTVHLKCICCRAHNNQHQRYSTKPLEVNVTIAILAVERVQQHRYKEVMRMRRKAEARAVSTKSKIPFPALLVIGIVLLLVYNTFSNNIGLLVANPTSLFGDNLYKTEQETSNNVKKHSGNNPPLGQQQQQQQRTPILFVCTRATVK